MRHGQARVSGGFSHTLPILAGFLFLGFAYGLLMRTKGFSFLYPMCMAMAIFGGSLEYITVSMLLIFGLCDETFSITCSADVPPEVDRGWFYLWVTVLLHIWRRQMLLSIAGGTIVYMLLVQMM